MTYTPERLVEAAKTFRAGLALAKAEPPSPGSILGLWLATADALEEALANHPDRKLARELIADLDTLNETRKETWEIQEFRGSLVLQSSFRSVGVFRGDDGKVVQFPDAESAERAVKALQYGDKPTALSLSRSHR